MHLNEGLQALDEGAFFSYGAGKGVKVPASVAYIGPQAIGYCPVDPDIPFAGTKKIDGFVVGGEPGSAAQSYAKTNEFGFETSICTAHQPVTETVDATCQTGGFTRTVCAVCGTVTESEKTASSQPTRLSPTIRSRQPVLAAAIPVERIAFSVERRLQSRKKPLH